MPYFATFSSPQASSTEKSVPAATLISAHERLAALVEGPDHGVSYKDVHEVISSLFSALVRGEQADATGRAAEENRALAQERLDLQRKVDAAEQAQRAAEQDRDREGAAIRERMVEILVGGGMEPACARALAERTAVPQTGGA